MATNRTKSGRFAPGHEKLGGRKPDTDTLNVISAQSRRALIEAAAGVGMYGNGEQGLVGYLRWVARYHPRIFARGLVSIMRLEILHGSAAEKPRRTLPEVDALTREFIRRGSKAESKSPEPDRRQILMQIAVENPKSFCKQLNDAFLKPEIARHKRARSL